MRRVVIAGGLVSCWGDLPAPVQNVAVPIRRTPYAAMMTALCGRVEQTWIEAPHELAGYRLVPVPVVDDGVVHAASTNRTLVADQLRTWRVVGASPFVELREERTGEMVSFARLRVEHGSARGICHALASESRIALDAVGEQRCAWQDPEMAHMIEVDVEDGTAWLACTL